MTVGWRRSGALLALVLATGCGTGPGGAPVSRSVAGTPSTATPVAGPPPPQGGALLQARPGGDGDSWKDTAGRSYRLGLVNAPEDGGARTECFGPQATAERRRLTAAGFTAEVYATDRYGRGVSVVRLPDGTNLNVELARRGFADDRYLARYRAENPRLASQLDRAFAAARAERAGLWGACPERGSASRP